MTEQQYIHYYGRVQGVGFRYTACRTAEGYDITGYVKNMPDGSVECVAEGTPAEINLFEKDLSDRMSGYIHRMTTQKRPASGQYTGFSARY